VIKTFADKRTKELYESGKSKRFPPGMWERALRRLEYLDLATSVTERVCFRFEDGDAYDVEITDYH
jgi:toxin HigB-1